MIIRIPKGPIYSHGAIVKVGDTVIHYTHLTVNPFRFIHDVKVNDPTATIQITRKEINKKLLIEVAECAGHTIIEE